jgi:hypothetical protein
MTNSPEKKVYTSKKVREQLKNLLLVLVGAIIFSFLMGILASIAVNYFVLNVFTYQSFLILLLTSIAVIILVYLLYYYYVFVPYSRISRNVIIPIIYDREEGEVIDDPFDGYYPQKLAWQAFERFKNEFAKIAKERIRKCISLPPQAGEKHILTELLEYMVILQLHSELYGFGTNKLKPDKTIEKLPAQLEKNTFISFFRELEPRDIVDKGMQQLEFILPEDIEIKYWSPAPIKGRTPDPNTFRIGFVGKYLEVHLTAHLASMCRISSMTCGPAPEFEGIYIRRYWQDKIRERLGKLWRAIFYINIEAKFRLRFGLFPNLSYIDWAEDWIYRFAKEGIFGGFDFNDFRRGKIESMLYDIYETVKETNVLVKNHENIKGMEKI